MKLDRIRFELDSIRIKSDGVRINLNSDSSVERSIQLEIGRFRVRFPGCEYFKFDPTRIKYDQLGCY